MMRRELPVGEFSLMNSLFNLAPLVMLPVAFLGSVWARKLAELRAREELGLAVHYVKRWTVYFVMYGAAISVVLYLRSDWLSGFLKTDDNAALYALMMGIIVSLGVSMF